MPETMVSAEVAAMRTENALIKERLQLADRDLKELRWQNMGLKGGLVFMALLVFISVLVILYADRH